MFRSIPGGRERSGAGLGAGGAAAFAGGAGFAGAIGGFDGDFGAGLVRGHGDRHHAGWAAERVVRELDGPCAFGDRCGDPGTADIDALIGTALPTDYRINDR